MTQKSPSAHHCTTLSGYIQATKACIDNWKKLLNSKIFSRCPHNMANFGPLTAEIGFRSLGHPSKFQRVSCEWVTSLFSKNTAISETKTGFVSSLHYCTDVAQRRPTKLCTIFGHLLGWYTIYTFSGALAPERSLPCAKFTLCPSLAFTYIDRVTARHSSSGDQPNRKKRRRKKDRQKLGMYRIGIFTIRPDLDSGQIAETAIRPDFTGYWIVT